MQFKIEKTEIECWKLTFNETVPLVNFKTDLPLLINDENKVILGNSLRDNYDMLDLVKCVIIKKDIYLENSLLEIEIQVAIEEENEDRLYEIEKEMKSYLSSFYNFEKLSLFDESEIRQTDIITKEIYKDPGDYDYIKHNVVDKQEEEEEGDVENASIFGDFGEY